MEFLESLKLIKDYGVFGLIIFFIWLIYSHNIFSMLYASKIEMLFWHKSKIKIYKLSTIILLFIETWFIINMIGLGVEKLSVIIIGVVILLIWTILALIISVEDKKLIGFRDGVILTICIVLMPVIAKYVYEYDIKEIGLKETTANLISFRIVFTFFFTYLYIETLKFSKRCFDFFTKVDEERYYILIEPNREMEIIEALVDGSILLKTTGEESFLIMKREDVFNKEILIKKCEIPSFYEKSKTIARELKISVYR